MNIFILDTDPATCAEYMVDSHVHKMALEHAQLFFTQVWDGYAERFGGMKSELYLQFLSTAKSMTPEERADMGIPAYLPSYQNHPCNRWLRESRANVKFLLELTKAINDEANFRHQRDNTILHLSYDLMQEYYSRSPECVDHLPNVSMTKFATACGSYLGRIYADDPVKCYRMYYNLYKRHLASWKNRSKPSWWIDGNPVVIHDEVTVEEQFLDKVGDVWQLHEGSKLDSSGTKLLNSGSFEEMVTEAINNNFKFVIYYH